MNFIKNKQVHQLLRSVSILGVYPPKHQRSTNPVHRIFFESSPSTSKTSMKELNSELGFWRYFGFLLQPWNIKSTELGITNQTPNKVNTSSHNSLARQQWSRRWSQSSLLLHMLHQLAKTIPRLIRLTMVSILTNAPSTQKHLSSWEPSPPSKENSMWHFDLHNMSGVKEKKKKTTPRIPTHFIVHP